MNLDQLIQAAREDGREAPSFERVLARREKRVFRGRVVRRAIGAASAMAVVVTVLLRAGSSSADAHVEEPTVVAAAADGDGGEFAHD